MSVVTPEKPREAAPSPRRSGEGRNPASFARYPKYKDSGVDWLGEVPAYWSLPKIKHIATFCGGGTPSRDNPAYWNGDIPWVSPKDMKAERINGAEESITDEGLTNSSSSLVATGAALLVVRSGILKHTIPVAINDVPVALNQDMKAIRFAADSCLTDFFLRWVQGLNNVLLLAWAKQGATVESIEHDYFAGSIIPLPPAHEQVVIASFLDRETAKIDALIAEQAKLIALLKEKRQALISHAVTKGLDPNAPMKDSGIEWLGQVPAHWETLPLRAIAMAPGGLFDDGDWIESKDLSDDGIRYITTGNVGIGFYKEQGSGFISEETFSALDCTEVQPGDILISRLNLPIGRACVVPDLGKRIVTSVDNVIVRASNKFDRRFLVYRLSSVDYLAEASNLASGATMQRLGRKALGQIRLCFPLPREQTEIARHLDSATIRLDDLIAEAEHAIALFKERRTALISAAVTGKIDVRNAP